MQGKFVFTLKNFNVYLGIPMLIETQFKLS